MLFSMKMDEWSAVWKDCYIGTKSINLSSIYSEFDGLILANENNSIHIMNMIMHRNLVYPSWFGLGIFTVIYSEMYTV